MKTEEKWKKEPRQTDMHISENLCAFAFYYSACDPDKELIFFELTHDVMDKRLKEYEALYDAAAKYLSTPNDDGLEDLESAVTALEEGKKLPEDLSDL